MSATGRGHGEPDPVAADLIEYIIVEVPDLDALASLVPALVELVTSAKIRILDLVAIEKSADGAVAALELDAVESMAALRDVDGEVGGMLSQHDIELASLALRPATAGIVLVTEDRWAESLSVAAHGVGGRILGGERIPACSRGDRAHRPRRRSPDRRPDGAWHRHAPQPAHRPAGATAVRCPRVRGRRAGVVRRLRRTARRTGGPAAPRSALPAEFERHKAKIIGV